MAYASPYPQKTLGSYVNGPYGMPPYNQQPSPEPRISTGMQVPTGQSSFQNYAQSPIQAPDRTTIGDAFKSLQPYLPEYKPLSGLGDEYYQNLFDSSQKRLRKQYFDDPNSILAQRANSLKRRGIYGGGLGESAVNDVYKSFGDEMADMQSQLNTQRAQSDLDISKFNESNRQELAKLGLSAAGDEARTATDFATKRFGSEVQQKTSEQDYITKILNTLTQAMGNELTDKDTRQYFEDIFGSQIGVPFGYRPPR